ncbi:MAG: CBS domain-containing protein [Candidatus Omnitrophota bacterium]
MKIREAMTKNVVKVAPSTGIRNIYDLFCEKQIGCVPVVNGDNKIVGMVTKTEILDVLIPDYFGMVSDFLFIDDFGALEKKLESLPVLELFLAEDLMERDVITINENASLVKAPVLMNKHNLRRLPVIDKDGTLVGIISKMDVCRALFKDRGTE